MDERIEASAEGEKCAAGDWHATASVGLGFGRADAHAALLRVLSDVEVFARRLVPAERRRCAPAAREDLVQFAALVALTRLQEALDAGASLPEWWLDDARLRAYLRGIVQRRLRRLLRDAPREFALPANAPTYPEPSALERQELRRGVLGCLLGLRVADLRLLARHAAGASYEELAPEFGASAAALAKRRARALAVLRARCLHCPLRRESTCPFVSLGWLAP